MRRMSHNGASENTMVTTHPNNMMNLGDSKKDTKLSYLGARAKKKMAKVKGSRSKEKSSKIDSTKRVVGMQNLIQKINDS